MSDDTVVNYTPEEYLPREVKSGLEFLVYRDEYARKMAMGGFQDLLSHRAKPAFGGDSEDVWLLARWAVPVGFVVGLWGLIGWYSGQSLTFWSALAAAGNAVVWFCMIAAPGAAATWFLTRDREGRGLAALDAVYVVYVVGAIGFSIYAKAAHPFHFYSPLVRGIASGTLGFDIALAAFVLASLSSALVGVLFDRARDRLNPELEVIRSLQRSAEALQALDGLGHRITLREKQKVIAALEKTARCLEDSVGPAFRGCEHRRDIGLAIHIERSAAAVRDLKRRFVLEGDSFVPELRRSLGTAVQTVAMGRWDWFPTTDAQQVVKRGFWNRAPVIAARSLLTGGLMLGLYYGLRKSGFDFWGYSQRVEIGAWALAGTYALYVLDPKANEKITFAADVAGKVKSLLSRSAD
jgi:hypothetical protein